jgi:hypothetical protein
MAIPNSRSLVRPAKDEWGVYDPQQAGMAALLARLDSKAAKTTPVAGAPASRKDVPEPAKLTARPVVRDAKK